jgi:hypothetical protein
VKRWLSVVLAAVLLLSAAPLALAHGRGHGWGHQKFQLVGTVVSPGEDPGTLMVQVKAGTRTLRLFKRTDQLLKLDVSLAQLRIVTDEGCVPATLDQLWPGATIKAAGTISGTDPLTASYTAQRAKVKGGVEPAPEPVPEPEPAPDPQPSPDPSDAPAPEIL